MLRDGQTVRPARRGFPIDHGTKSIATGKYGLACAGRNSAVSTDLRL
jgi:hypothetical protein